MQGLALTSEEMIQKLSSLNMDPKITSSFLALVQSLEEVNYNPETKSLSTDILKQDIFNHVKQIETWLKIHGKI